MHTKNNFFMIYVSKLSLECHSKYIYICITENFKYKNYFVRKTKYDKNKNTV